MKETIFGFKGILDGKYDHLPEQSFYMVGDINEVIEKAQQGAAELDEQKGREDGKKDDKGKQSTTVRVRGPKTTFTPEMLRPFL